MTRRVASIWLPTWATDRLRRHAGAPPPDAPLILAAKEGNRRIVTSACAAAQALGISPGVPVAKAQACVPGLTVLDATPETDLAALIRLAHWAARHYTPFAAIDPPDGLWLDINGAAHLFGGEAKLVAHLVRRLKRRGIDARAAVADTPGAAHAVVRFGDGKPVQVVPMGASRDATAQLPIAALRVEAEVVDRLNRLGFERISQLLNTPRGPLVHRLGSSVVERIDQLLGHAGEPIAPLFDPGAPAARLVFAEPIAAPESLARVADDLIDLLVGELTEQQAGAKRLDLLFHRVDGGVQAVQAGLARPSREAAHLARLLKPRLEAIDPGFGIEAATLVASRIQSLPPSQIGQDETPDLAALVDRISSRIGSGAVYTLGAVESDLPERSVRKIRAFGAAPASWPDELPRPARLFNPPELVDQVLAELPDQPPLRFRWRRRQHRVRRADGPERIYGEWWSSAGEAATVRDYFQVEDEQGARFWLFRHGDGADLATGSMRWYVQGAFA